MPSADHLRALSRRALLRQGAYGLGASALASMLARDLAAGEPARPQPHHAPKAKSLILLFMAGGPSQIDLFDPKPKLAELDGKPVPESLIKGERFAFIKGVPNCMASAYAFARHGQSGAQLSTLLPHLATVADDIAIVRSMKTSEFNHAPGQVMMCTGHQLFGRPSIGSWLTYGLGSASADLPGYVVLLSGTNNPDGGAACWSAGFLPTVHQGVQFRSAGDPVLYVANPDGMAAATRRASLDALKDLNQARLDAIGDPEIATRIAQYEMAYRMQTSVPELMAIDREPKSVHELYGTTPGQVSFANNCLLARRLVERGVRVVTLFHRGWDHHGTNAGDSIDKDLPNRCRQTDQGAAALIKDLKRAGLLDSTLVVWGGEFGRTPMKEARGGSKIPGRDHHGRCFSLWLAGGGVKPGLTLGETDELGWDVTKRPVDVHDLHATILHLLGIDHTRLTFRFQGRDYRLTDVHGNVVKQILT